MFKYREVLMYDVRCTLCRKVEVEIRNGAKEAITQEWRVLATTSGVTHQPHLVCLCCYRWYNNSNYYDVIGICTQSKSLNTLDWLEEFDF